MDIHYIDIHPNTFAMELIKITRMQSGARYFQEKVIQFFPLKC